jgi:hypothetical protein
MLLMYMINTLFIEKMLYTFQEEQNDLNQKMITSTEKKKIFKQSEALGLIIKHIINYNENYLIIKPVKEPKIPKTSKESVVKTEIKKYNVQSFLN